MSRTRHRERHAFGYSITITALAFPLLLPSVAVLLIIVFEIGLDAGLGLERVPTGLLALSYFAAVAAGTYLPCRALYTGLRWEPDPTDTRFCQQCDYDLTGNVSGVCPECGTAIPPDDHPGP